VTITDAGGYCREPGAHVPTESSAPASAYDPAPTLPLPDQATILCGDAIWQEAARIAMRTGRKDVVIAVDAYPGADLDGIVSALRNALPDWKIINVEEAASLSFEARERIVAANVTDDRVFGVMSHHNLADFYDDSRLDQVAEQIRAATEPTVVVGWGAALAPIAFDCLVLVEVARWELQRRQRAGAPNWRAPNHAEDSLRKFKRSYFVEWRLADRHKRTLFDSADLIVDGAAPLDRLTAVAGQHFREAMAAAASRPFRVVPFFDPGVWGGQWMKHHLGLDTQPENYAWCFDCVPEENSLVLTDGREFLECPAIDAIFLEPRRILGEKTFARFGAEFPIRFDFLDTMGGGNLSLQVHPSKDYIYDKFGMSYTQDESYYILDCAEDSVVYLGVKEGIDREDLRSALAAANMDGTDLEAEKYINTFRARKHDHFSIPAGTIHCSGSDTMVLEISATPYIFTFKLWDWGRLGLDGQPRPINLEHGMANIRWERDTEWVQREILQPPVTIRSEPGVTEESTGLHPLEFIETRRHWFASEYSNDTLGTVHVLNLVEGDEVAIVSASDSFEPFILHYAETVIIPAAVGEYRLERTEQSHSDRFATITAFVRGTSSTDRC